MVRRGGDRGGQSTALHAGPLRELPQFVLLPLLLLRKHLALDAGADLDRLPSLLLGHVHRLAQLGEVVVDGGLLKAPAICRKALVQWDGVPLAVLPVRDARGDLPVELVLLGQLARGRVEHGNGRAAGAARHALVLELGRLQGIHVRVRDANEALLAARTAGTRALGRRVTHVPRLAGARGERLGLRGREHRVHLELKRSARPRGRVADGVLVGAGEGVGRNLRELGHERAVICVDHLVPIVAVAVKRAKVHAPARGRRRRERQCRRPRRGAATAAAVRLGVAAA